MRVRAIIAVFILIVSCQGIEPIEKPENLIPLKTMEHIIYDLAIMNSARGYNIQMFSQTGIKPESYVFEKHKIDSLQYAQSTIYYSANVEKYKNLLTKVQKRVQREFKVADSIAKEEKRVKDSLRNERGKKLKQEKDSVNQLQRKVGRVVPKTVIKE